MEKYPLNGFTGKSLRMLSHAVLKPFDRAQLTGQTVPVAVLGSLRSDDGDGNGNGNAT